MIVESEPSSASLHQTLVDILGPHGLEPRIGPHGSVLVVPRQNEPIMVTIDSPSPFESVFGEIEIAAQVYGEEALDRLELLVNGESVGVLRYPPFSVRVDVGLDNIDRTFEVRAYGRWGGFGSSVVDTHMVSITDQVEVALRQLFVSVTNSAAHDFELDRDSFTVIDSGIRQQLVTFGRGDIPITAVLLVDASESMRGAALEAALSGARSFLDQMNELDEAMLMMFADRPLAVSEFTQDKSELLAELSHIDAGGPTALNDHLYAALRMLDERRGRRVVVLISDGADVLSGLGIEDVLWKIRRSDAQLFWIRLDTQGTLAFSSAWRNAEANQAEWEGLEQAVKESGGRIEVLPGVEQIHQAFANILRDLRSQYALGYYPTERQRDGDWRQVRVKVADSRARIRFRAGYVDN